MWTDFYRDGGWGMYPTTLFGFFLVISGVILLLRPERRYVPLFCALSVLTLGSGLLGCCTGFIATFRYLHQVAPAEQLQIAALGCAESLNNLVLGLMLFVATTLLAALGAARAVWARPAAPAAG